MEKVGTKPAEHANVCNIFKDNNMDYYHIVFPCPVKNCRSGESLSFSLLFITITPFHHSPLHHFINFSYYHIRNYSGEMSKLIQKYQEYEEDLLCEFEKSN